MSICFFDRIAQRAKDINSLLCVGLDPHYNADKENSAEEAFAFCKTIIDATTSVAVAYKPNAAFFEALGPSGIEVLIKIVAYIPDEIPVLYDSKRGDIFTTAQAYKRAAFDVIQADAITLAPYMGLDSVKPFSENKSKGCFVLCKTSNPSSKDMQELTVNGQYLYQHVAKLADDWNENNNIGLVVGATDVEAIKRVRQVVPNMWILAPGIGAQGGDLEATVKFGMSSDKLGILLPISRGIANAEDPKQAAMEFRDAINAARQQAPADYSRSTISMDFVDFALTQKVLKFGDFTLKSGRQSPYFFNAGLFNSGPALLKLGRFYAKAIHDSGVQYDVLFGPAYKGITLVAAIAIALADLYNLDVPYAYNRKEAKDHGEGGLLVGADMTGKRVLIVDDVITAGTAIREAIEILKATDAIPIGVCISLDRQENVSKAEPKSAVQLVQENCNLSVISIATLKDLIEYLKQKNEMESLHRIEAYRASAGI